MNPLPKLHRPELPLLAPAHSVLDAGAVARYVLAQYPLGTLSDVQFWAHGVNDSYRLRTDVGDFLVRVYRHGWRTWRHVYGELQLLHFLQQQGAAVAAPQLQLQLQNPVSYAVQAPEGERYVAVFDYIDGVLPTYQDELAAGQAACYGEALARLHQASVGYLGPWPRELDLAHLLHQPVQRIALLLTQRPADLALLQEIERELAERLTALAPRLDYGFCHGDTHGQNAHLQGQQLVFFDFDCCGAGWRVYDLAVFCWMARVYRQVAARCPPFIDAYLKVRSLSHADIGAIPLLVVVRQLWWLALQIDMGSAHGLGWLDSAAWDRQSALWRELMAETQPGQWAAYLGQ
ncbi:Ser/Thr protein kinase RdoA involved in Cpx stress response, MazF antagonist [Andreprevotia lacus DSM 23236]|jgi:Ser/Thr protein kinase RdoA (MazF antagonist)|uniref:Ser/Thr protein kinase RdoA involved in Cpx stress response, MazF antagonist n=1 Tax=Andreprevotia lacus DSM 23236 TaxID=1121001 RepID=A0A1W1X8H4_9NEIS|nr:phosphotransferase [Andreprevotia lacus]SMC20236.1 Ser/Thr protein kinase RdoA involved in Cpx stress response, MazF antagonist [Andreprevotia lacus DSM 23236]